VLSVERTKLLEKVKQLSNVKVEDHKLNKRQQNLLKEAAQIFSNEGGSSSNDDSEVSKLMGEMQKLQDEIANVKDVFGYKEAAEKKTEMAEITNPAHNDKLYQYYKTFNMVFSDSFLAYKQGWQ